MADSKDKAETLLDVVGECSMRALVLHARDKGINAADRLDALKAIIRADYNDMVQTLNDALEANMGDAMYRNIINTYVNAWAVQALKKS